MKLNYLKPKLGSLTYLLILPLFFFTFCQSESDTITLNESEVITKDSKVIAYIQLAINGNSVEGIAKKDEDNKDDNDDQCTEFQYPLTTYAYIGDNPAKQTIVLKNDEELLVFIENLTATDRVYIEFPVTLIDGDGVETVINDLTEFEGTLQMIVDACVGFDDDDDEDDDNVDYQYCQNNNKKVYICHKGKTICVSINAIWGHLNQHEEDYLGKCDD